MCVIFWIVSKALLDPDYCKMWYNVMSDRLEISIISSADTSIATVNRRVETNFYWTESQALQCKLAILEYIYNKHF